jgi:hypothetical protein
MRALAVVLVVLVVLLATGCASLSDAELIWCKQNLGPVFNAARQIFGNEDWEGQWWTANRPGVAGHPADGTPEFVRACKAAYQMNH